MSHLFSATRIGQLTLDNRIVIAPMCQYSADEGKATSWHRIHLGQLAFSGAGLLILEATAVEPAGRISPGDLGLWDDETENALRAVVEDIRAWSPIPLGIQLGHAGRKASCAAPWQGGHQLALNQGGWQTVAAPADSEHPGRTQWIAPPHIDPGQRPRVNQRHHIGEILAAVLAHHRARRDAEIREHRRRWQRRGESDDDGAAP